MFVTGKGGTGKSTVAAGLARAAAASGLRTLACEMDAKGSLAAALGVPTPGFEPIVVSDRLWSMTMDTESSLREYLRVHLRLPFVAKIGPLASTFDFVADAAPGVKEVLAIGKVCWEVREDHFDIVIVDGEASGHIVSQIASPRVIHSLVPRGPLRDQTGWMLDILDDASRCGVVVVATAEDMVVSESLDLMGRIASETRASVACVVVNRAEEPPIPDDLLPVFGGLRGTAAAIPGAPATLGESLDAVADLVARHAEARRQRDRLAAAVSPVPIIDVPLVAPGAGDRGQVPDRRTVVAAIADIVGGATW